MASIAEIRRRYPQYSDLSDEELADRLYTRYYSDMPRDEFDARVGLRTAATGTVSADAPLPTEPVVEETSPSVAGDAPSRWDTFLRGQQIGLQGVGRALAEVAGFPSDMAAAGHNILTAGAEGALNAVLPEEYEVSLPRVERPFLGSEHLSSSAAALAEMLGLNVIAGDEMSPRERLGYNINRFGTDVLTGATGLARLAAQEAGQVGRRLPRWYDSLTRPYQETPGRAFSGDIGAGVGAGTALTGAEQLPEQLQGPFTDLAATMIGGTGGSMLTSLVRSPAAVARSIERSRIDPDIPVDPETGLPFTRREADLAAEFVQRQASDPQRAAETITRRADEFRAEGDPVPSVDIISDDIGLMGLGRTARVTDRKPFEERDQALRDAATRRVVGIRDEARVSQRPLSEADPRAPQRLAEQIADTQIGEARRAADEARGRVSEAEDRLRRAAEQLQEMSAPVLALRGTEGQASQRLDDVVVNQTMLPRQAENRRLIESIDPDRTIERDARPFMETAQQIRNSAGRLSGQAGIPTEFIERIERLAADPEPDVIRGRKEQTVTMGELVEVRPYLNTAMENARNAGEFTLANNIARLKKEINAEIDRLAAEGGPGSEAAAAAQRYYKEEFAPFFGQGRGRLLRDAVNRDDPARTRTPPSATAEKFLIAGTGGSDEAARDLARILEIAPNPIEGRRAVRDYMVARLAQTADQNGEIQPARLGAWIDNHQNILRHFPELADELTELRRNIVNRTEEKTRLQEEIRRFTNDLKAAEGNVEATQRRVQRGALGVLLNNDPDKAVNAVLNSGDRERAMAEIMDIVKNNPEAREGWRRAVIDNVIDRVTTTNKAMRGDEISSGMEGPVSVAQLNRLFKRYEDALAQVFTPEEMAELRRAHRILEPLGNLGRRATAGSDTVEKLMATRREPFRNALEAIIKLHFGGLRGGNIMRNLRLGARSLPSAAADADRLVARMWFEPELAAHLLTREVEKAGTPGWNKRLLQLLGVSEAARESLESEAAEGEDEQAQRR